MTRIAFATYQAVPGLNPDDVPLARRLNELGVEVVAAVWNDTLVDWSAFDGVLIRSTWDYHAHLDDYARWIGSFASGPTRLWNAPAIVLPNLHKFYLRELENSGVRLIPTEFVARDSHDSLESILSRRMWEHAIVKPAVSAGSIGIWRATRIEPDEARFQSHVAESDLLIQGFRAEILDEGEWSLIYYDGRFSHAVIKRPAPDDFRVQMQFGGQATAVEPPEWMLRTTARILEVSARGERPLYARIDGIRHQDRFLLMEVEMIEPYLFQAHYDRCVDRLANAVLERVS